MGLLNREAILGAADLKTEDVDVPEWGGTVRVSMLTGAARDALGSAMLGADGKPNMSGYREKLVAMCVVDEVGERQFSADDVAALANKSATAITRVFEVADRLNRLGAGAVEDVEKNSSSGQSGASSSDGASRSAAPLESSSQ